MYNLKNIDLGYNKDNVVLHVEELELRSNKIIFILGKSGIGKSTLIEFLGLMNNTLIQSSNSTADLSFEGQKINFLSIWNEKEKVLSALRKKHFAFVFQSDNLMPNFTVGENIVFSQLIKGTSYSKAKSIVLELLEALKLSKSDYFEKIENFSGGQKQRLSFIRAISTNFNILFCDEPTGNLDIETAKIAMDVLNKDIHKRKAMAIIVSHNIKLAMDYADEICVLVEEDLKDEKKIGKLKNQNIFQKDEWQNAPEKFKAKIELLLK